MFPKKIVLQMIQRYPFRTLLTVILGFSGALFNGVSATLIVPVLLNILGQKINLEGAPPVIKSILYPFESLPEDYRLAVMAGAILLAVSCKNLANYASTLMSSSLMRKFTCDLRETGLTLLLDVDLDFYSKMRLGDIIARVGVEVNRTSGALSTLLKLFITAITVLIFISLLLAMSWKLTLATTALVALIVGLNQYAISRSKHFGKLLSNLSRAYSTKIFETLSGIRLVKATGNEDREFRQLKKLIRDREKAEFQSQVNSAAIGPINEVSSMLALLAIVVLGRRFFPDEIASLATVLLTYLFVLFRALPYISNLNTNRSRLANATTSIAIVSDFLRRDNKPFVSNGSIPYKQLKQEIHFDNLSFAYPNNNELVLKKIDLHIPRGTTLALVGGSGAGKSTLADLLPRFYDPTHGRITLDGRDIREFDLKTFRKTMGIVSQETFLFNDTVRNNIAYARLDASETEVIDAAKRANAYEFIERLPNGMETLIGDRGVMLSGGQRQRLAIARALLQDPEILVLDEATSALDTVSERLVQSALDDLSRDRTTLVIAHRLSTVQNADQIAVLDQGQVVELGKHEELLQQGGHYARLYSMQFSNRAIVPLTKTFTRISYEIRNRLNSMINSLRLLADNLDDPNEREDLIQESYNAAVRIFNNVEMLEDSIKFQMSLYTMQPDSGTSQNAINRQEVVNKASYQIRTHLNAAIGFLRLLNDDMADSQEEQNELVKEAYESTGRLLETLEFLEVNMAN